MNSIRVALSQSLDSVFKQIQEEHEVFKNEKLNTNISAIDQTKENSQAQGNKQSGGDVQSKENKGPDEEDENLSGLSSDALRRLQTLLKEELFFGAMELVESVTLLEDDLGRKIFRVESMSRRGHYYYTYFGVYYCTCSHITAQNINRICKHLIASRIALALCKFTKREITSAEMCEKFAHFDDV